MITILIGGGVARFTTVTLRRLCVSTKNRRMMMQTSTISVTAFSDERPGLVLRAGAYHAGGRGRPLTRRHGTIYVPQSRFHKFLDLAFHMP